jgi:hypothetical protein
VALAMPVHFRNLKSAPTLPPPHIRSLYAFAATRGQGTKQYARLDVAAALACVRRLPRGPLEDLRQPWLAVQWGCHGCAAGIFSVDLIRAACLRQLPVSAALLQEAHDQPGHALAHAPCVVVAALTAVPWVDGEAEVVERRVEDGSELARLGLLGLRLVWWRWGVPYLSRSAITLGPVVDSNVWGHARPALKPTAFRCAHPLTLVIVVAACMQSMLVQTVGNVHLGGAA